MENNFVDYSSPDELRTKVHADDLQAFDDALAIATNTGTRTSVSYRCFTEGDGEVQFESTFLPCNNSVVACTVNQTAIKQMQKWEKQYRTLVNTLFPNFIFVWDEDFHYVDVIIPDGLRLFHTREELIGQDARQYYAPEVSDLLIANIREALKTNQCREVEHHIELHGSRFFYQTRIVPVDGDKAFCLVRDIGDRVRRMEELLAQRQRAEESDKMKSELIANMSHEVRTPLNAIVGFSEFLINELMPEKRQKYMDLIRSNNAVLLQIVNDILDLSRLESGKSEFHFEETDITNLIMEVSEEYMLNMKQGIKFIPDFPENDIHVITDANRVKQVLNNLIFNAIKFTQKGAITLKVEEGFEHLIFSISDTGCGIHENMLETIFDRFSKLNRFSQGTGLGLPICKTIVKLLGGHISVKSKVDQGSVFSFTIPYRHTAPQKEIIGDASEFFANKRKKVLIYETASEDMKHIANILTKKYDIVEVTDIDRIINSFILDQPNLVLISMEAVSKENIVAKIHAITPSIPVIAMTTSDFYHDQRLAIDYGCIDVIAKPFPPSKLEEVVMAFIV